MYSLYFLLLNRTNSRWISLRVKGIKSVSDHYVLFEYRKETACRNFPYILLNLVQKQPEELANSAEQRWPQICVLSLLS